MPGFIPRAISPLGTARLFDLWVLAPGPLQTIELFPETKPLRRDSRQHEAILYVHPLFIHDAMRRSKAKRQSVSHPSIRLPMLVATATAMAAALLLQQGVVVVGSRSMVEFY